jgi:DNA-binding transcriptional ArsR family regulator
MTDALSATFAALADPTRRAILARLERGEATVGELARPFAMSQPAVSKHLAVLERAGLISRGRDAQRRPCRLDARRLRDASEWIERYRRFWDESFDRLEDYLKETKGEPSRRRGEKLLRARGEEDAPQKEKEKRHGRPK